MLEVKNVTKYYDKLCAVDHLSFQVKPGEIFGLLGLNGAGKTTTFRMILGLLDDYQGEILLDGQKIDYTVTDKIGFLTEERSLLTKLTVEEQIIYYGVLKGMNESLIKEKLDYWLTRLGLKDYQTKKIKELSKGNQQKVQFISAIIHEPKLLILDEPFSGLDPLNVELFKKIIKEFQKKGTIIIFSSHRMEHVELFCQKLAILVRGKTVLIGDLQEIKKAYQKKTIVVKANLDCEKIKSLKGVISIENNNNEYTIKIENDRYINPIFKEISKCLNVTKFIVEDASLNEIFINTVGEKYE